MNVYLGFARRGRPLEFALDEGIDPRLVSGTFPVPKSAERERLVSNRRPRNAVERSIGAAAELFPHGSVFTELLVGARARVRGSEDDLPDFYHTVRVSEARARTTLSDGVCAFATLLT